MKELTINTEKLKELRPCTERFKNWLENYAEFNGTFCEFLSLDKITYEDKIYVVKKLVPREILEQWAIMCAESVLYIFESIYPNDKRPRECIKYLKTGDKNEEKLRQHRIAAAAATYAADAVYDAAAAAAAAYAATYAADAVYDAAAAAYAADAAYAAYAERSKQKDKNIWFLKSLLSSESAK